MAASSQASSSFSKKDSEDLKIREKFRKSLQRHDWKSALICYEEQPEKNAYSCHFYLGHFLSELEKLQNKWDLKSVSPLAQRLLRDVTTDYGYSILFEGFALSLMINEPKWCLLTGSMKDEDKSFDRYWTFLSQQRYSTSIHFTLYRFALLFLDVTNLQILRTLLPPPKISIEQIVEWNESRKGETLTDEIVSWFE